MGRTRGAGRVRETGEFRELANQDQVWRRSEHWRVAASRRPPWPDDPPARLAWWVAHRAVLIAPTAAEPSHVEGEVRRPHHAAEEGLAKRGGFRGGAGPDLRRTSACFKQGLVLALALSGFDQCTNDRRACRCTALRRSVPPSRQAEGAQAPLCHGPPDKSPRHRVMDAYLVRLPSWRRQWGASCQRWRGLPGGWFHAEWQQCPSRSVVVAGECPPSRGRRGGFGRQALGLEGIQK